MASGGKRRLGKGIDALLQGRDLSQLEEQVAGVVSVPVEKIRPNPDQPRKEFNPEALEELSRSIGERGVIQPILAEEQENGEYLIVAGERRYRAARMAGLTVVPVLPGSFSAEERLEIALIENIQREDLNPMEEARAYRQLMENSSLSQEELAARLGISRSAVANTVRLLNLPESVQGAIGSGRLSPGHARTLLAIKEPGAQEKLFHAIEEKGLSVRQTERAVALVGAGASPELAVGTVTSGAGVEEAAPAGSSAPPVAAGSPPSGSAGVGPKGSEKSVEMGRIEQKLIEALGTKVKLSGTNDQGKIEVAYYSMEDLERLASLLGVDLQE
ncbi:MAG: ParB/RepB/Spo0J family partition protein [Alkalispirochaetaceae bacterium]